jgi:hypothetical protein
VVCFIDGCFLLDACWRCGALLDPLTVGGPAVDFRCVRRGAGLAAAPTLAMPETLRDQQMLFAGLMSLLIPGEPAGIATAAQAYIDELSAGALRGSNPANPADRHNAVMMAARRIRDAALRPQRRTKRRRRARAAGRLPGVAARSVKNCTRTRQRFEVGRRLPV